jgi:hypothetical protein
MNWLAASILAAALAGGAPLLLTEAVLYYRRQAGHELVSFARKRRLLRLATCAVWAAIALWFTLDYANVAAGRRSFVISAVNVVAFANLFFTFAAGILWPARPNAAVPAATQPAVTASRLQLTRRELVGAGIFVAALLATALVAFVSSGNDAGYRAKSVVLMVGGLGLLLLDLQAQRIGLVTALLYFSVFQIAAILTLTLDFENDAQRWIGLASHVTAFVVGSFGCARALSSTTRA